MSITPRLSRFDLTMIVISLVIAIGKNFVKPTGVWIPGANFGKGKRTA